MVAATIIGHAGGSNCKRQCMGDERGIMGMQEITERKRTLAFLCGLYAAHPTTYPARNRPNSTDEAV
jgi:hypothetical protein